MADFDDEWSGGGLWWRGVMLCGLLVWSVVLIRPPIVANAAGTSFLHLINLPFHEAGHVFCRPFGQFITTLGGSLGQVAMPLVCLGVFLLKTRDPFAAAVALWWTGENFLDIAPYINDARAGVMPLVGGNFGHSSPYGFHDWEYLLTETGLLAHDHGIAKFVFFCGTMIMLAALAWAGLVLYGRYRDWREWEDED